MFFSRIDNLDSLSEVAKKLYEENQNAINNLFSVIEIVLKIATLLDTEYDCNSYVKANYIKKKNLERVKEIMSECYGEKELSDYTPKFDALDSVLIYAKSKSKSITNTEQTEE